MPNIYVNMRHSHGLWHVYVCTSNRVNTAISYLNIYVSMLLVDIVMLHDDEINLAFRDGKKPPQFSNQCFKARSDNLQLYHYHTWTSQISMIQIKFKRKKIAWRWINNLSQAVKVMLLLQSTINQHTEIIWEGQENTTSTVIIWVSTLASWHEGHTVIFYFSPVRIFICSLISLLAIQY